MFDAQYSPDKPLRKPLRSLDNDNTLQTRDPIFIFKQIEKNKKTKFDRLLETLRKELPRGFKIGAAVGAGDCFFDAVAQGLNELNSNEKSDVKSLRKSCKQYAQEKLRKSKGSSWLHKALKGENEKNIEEYVPRIEFTAEDIKNANSDSEIKILKLEHAIWGRPEIEGKMICEKYKTKIKVIEFREKKVDGLNITTADVGKGRNVVYIVNYRNHFVPLLSNIEKDIEKSVPVSREEVYGVIDKDSSPLLEDIGNYDLEEHTQMIQNKEEINSDIPEQIKKKHSKPSDNRKHKSSKKHEPQPGPSRQVGSTRKQPLGSLEKGVRRSDDEFSQPGFFNAKQENQQPFSNNNCQYKSRSLNQISGAQLLSQQQQQSKELSEDDKILKNGQLFNAIRKDKTSEEKLKKVQKHLDEGADVNARDANDKNNSPLHIAVLKGEPQIVELLLDRKAIIDNKNADDEVPLDIAKRLNMPYIIQILELRIQSSQQASVKEQSAIQQQSWQSFPETSHQVDSPIEQSSGRSESTHHSQSKSSSGTQSNKRTNSKSGKQTSREKKEPIYEYQKRAGTAGVSGQLYETKLSTLLLLRALNNKKNRFFLGTNRDGIGAFDDLIFRYEFNEQEKPRVIFIQAKHKDNPSKGKLTVEEVQKRDGDFSLYKYLDSYLRIKQEFNQNSNDDIFKGEFKNIDCDFVIYTTAKENFSKKKLVEQPCINKDDLIHSSEAGKIFQFNYEDNDIDLLVKTASESRTKLLVESLAKFILSDKNNYSHMMSDELIKSYHVVLAQKVIKVSEEVSTEDQRQQGNKTKKKNKTQQGEFRDDFFSNSFEDSNLLSIFRRALYEKVIYSKKSQLAKEEIIKFVNQIILEKTPSAETISKLIGSVLIFDAKSNRLKFKQEVTEKVTGLPEKDLEKKEITHNIADEAVELAGKKELESFKIRLPDSFGNLDLRVTKEKRLEHLANKFIELFKDTEVTADNIVKIDDAMVGINNKLTEGDVKVNGGIGGLVGNLLILDEETKMLKFNDKSLPENAREVFEKLKDKILKDKDLKDKNLSNYKFKINVNGFPRLSLVDEKYDRSLIKDFLDKLKFYTDQAKEDEVEEILKEEINKHNVDKEQNKFLFRVKSDAIFLKVHDKVQKWWKLTGKAPYLTESCEFFDQAKKDIIDSPLLTILNFICTNKINDIEFNQEAIQALELNKFLTGPDKRILNIVTDENTLSSLKLAQYFKNSKDYIFIDLDYILRVGCYKEAISEFKETGPDTLIIGCKEHDTNRDIKNLEKPYKELKGIIDGKLSKKIILITKKNDILAKTFKEDFPRKYIEKTDEKNGLTDLEIKSQEKLLKEGKVIFQGEEINLDTLVDGESKCLIDGEVLSKLIDNERIEIGEPLSNLDDVKGYYIDRVFNRQIEIKKDIEKKRPEFFITYSSQDIIQPKIQQEQDIVLISDRVDDFKELCDKYEKSNIHWLKKKDDKLVWQQSRGALSEIRKFIDERGIEEYKPEKVTDISDKVVIIAAEPGMGKSTVLTHLAVETKKSDHSLWIVRINLLDCSTELNRQKERETRFDEMEAIKFLYRTAGFQSFRKEKREQPIENVFNSITVKDSKISLENDGKEMKGLSLLEIGLFNDFYNRGKIALLFDGFDEISPDYKEKVIELLQTLKDAKVEKLWVATRPYGILNQLESKLSTFSYKLRPFNEKDQRSFLEKFWKKNLKLNELDNDQFSIFTNELLERFSQSITDQKNEFLSIPLQTYMIARVFQDTFKEFCDSGKRKFSEELDLVTLYRRFIDIKFYEIRFGEKKPGINTADPDIKRQLRESMRKFIEDHRKLAVYTLFKEDEMKKLLSEQEIREVGSLIKEIEQGEEKNGIINKIVNGKPNFVHRTFAEYFATELVSDKLKSTSSTESIWDFLVNTIFIASYQNVRRFFDSKLARDHELANLSSHNSHKEAVFELLLKQDSETSLYVAVKEGLVEITNFLLKSVEGSLNEDNLDDFIVLITQDSLLRLAIEKGNNQVMENLLKCVADVDADRLIKVLTNAKNENDLPLHLAVQNNKEEIVNILLKDIEDTDQIVQIINISNDECYGKTVLHLVAEMSSIEIILKYIEKLDTEQRMEVFSATDYSGRVPTHYAAETNDFEFFDALYSLLNQNQFSEVCTAIDGNDSTPMNLFDVSVDDYDKINCKACEFQALEMRVYSYSESDIEFNEKQQKAFLDLSKFVSSYISHAEIESVKQGLHLPSFKKRGIKIKGECAIITRGLSQVLFLQGGKSFLNNLETSAEIYERIAQGKQVSRREEREIFAFGKLLDDFEQELDSPTNSLPLNLIYTKGCKTLSGLSDYIAGARGDFAVHLVTSNHVVAIYGTGDNYAYFDSNTAFVSGLKSADQLMKVVEKGMEYAGYKVGEKGFLVEHFDIDKANNLLSDEDRQVLTREIKTERQLLAEQDKELGPLRSMVDRVQLYDFGTKINVEGGVPLLINADMNLSSKKFQDHLDKKEVSMTAREYLDNLKNSKNVEEVIQAAKIIPFIGSRREIEEAEQIRRPKQSLLELVKETINYILAAVSLTSASWPKSQMSRKGGNKPETHLNAPTVERQLQRSPGC